MSTSDEYLDVSAEVAESISAKKPVVALESTIISHGMPYPQNVETALRVERMVRDCGATPATIAVIRGRMKAGLSADEIELLGQEGLSVAKVSRRDLPFVVSAKKNGATTVASTMIIAEKANIAVFATGGIGGVHRGAEKTLDISADLQELSRTSVAVVCAGAKSILDLGMTLEYLETQGVAVIGYRTDSLPAFFCRTSPFNVSVRLDTAKEIALAMKAKWGMGLGGGIVVANPIPQEYALSESQINDAINRAVVEASGKGIHGKDATPFLLARLCEITGGDSLAANIHLVLNNARLAAEIAIDYAAKS